MIANMLSFYFFPFYSLYMDHKAHAAIALICAFGVFYFFFGIIDPIKLLIFGAVALIACLLPDIDMAESKGRAALDFAIIAGASLFSYSSSCGGGLCIPGIDQLTRIAFLSLALLGFYFLFTKFVMPRHRGFTHTIVSCLAFTVLLYLFIDRFFALAGFIGYFSHLVADKELKMV